MCKIERWEKSVVKISRRRKYDRRKKGNRKKEDGKLRNSNIKRIVMHLDKIEGVNGSYTVEAALIMPVVVFVMLALIYMSFYMHDKSRIQAIIDTAIIESGLIVKHEMDIENRKIDYIHLDDRGIYFPIVGNLEKEKDNIKKTVKEQLESGLFLANITNITVDINHSKVEIKVDVLINITILRVKEFFTGSGTKITISSKGNINYPAEFVRRLDTLEGIVDNVKGYDQVIEKLQSIIKD